MILREPARQGEVFLQDLRQAVTSDPENLHLWWLGQSGFLVVLGETRVLFDPYLSDSLTRKYAGTDKEHLRVTGNVIEPARLTDIDVVTSTHNHTDHLDAETLLPLKAANPDLELLIPEANRAFVRERLGVAPDGSGDWFTGLDAWESTTVKGLSFTGVPAAHNEVERDEAGRCRFLGYILELGRWTLYHSGDTRPIPGLAERLKPYRIDLAMLPINGSLEERRVAGNLWGQEAAALADNAGIRWVVPCHYDLFAFNTVTPLAFREACEARRLEYGLLRPGGRLSLS